MSKIHFAWKSFSNGEISPLYDGQIGFEKYYTSCKILKNMLPTVQGAAIKRPGFRYVIKTKYDDNDSRLIPFDYSIDQAYLIEAGNNYFRFIKNRGQIVNPYPTPYEISSTYMESELFDIQYAQSLDTLYLVHKNHFPAKLVRTNDTSWALSDLIFIKKYYPDNLMLTSTFNAFNASYCIDEQFTTRGYNNNGDGVNTYLELNTGTTNAKNFIRIDLYISESILNAIYDIEYYNGSAWVKAVTGWDLSKEPLGWVTKNWTSVGSWYRWRLLKTNAAITGGNVMEVEFYELGTPKEWVAGKYPTSVGFYEQRLWFANDNNIWMSETNDYYNFTFGSNADSAIKISIADNQLTKIQWLSPGMVMNIGTATSEYRGSTSSLQEAITPTNIRLTKQTANGSINIQPVNIDDVILYVTRTRKKLREYSKNTLEDNYSSPDMSIFVEHLLKDGIKTMTYQQEPYSIIWIVTQTNKLLSFTYQRLEGIAAWAQHESSGQFKDCMSIYGKNGYDELYVIKRCFINNAWVRYIEVLEISSCVSVDLSTKEDGYVPEDHLENYFFVDSGLSYDGDPATTFTGFEHLEGEEVAILADGIVVPSQIVTNGTITLVSPARKVHAGKLYASILQTMRPEYNDQEGTAQGREKRINRVVFRLLRTHELKYGKTENGILKEIKWDTQQLFSGDTRGIFPSGWDKEGYITVVHTSPTPLTIISIIPELGVS